MESTLLVHYSKLLGIVGDFLGIKRDTKEWSEDERRLVDDIIESGLRQFYYPEPIGRESMGHEWSFLRPITTMETESGVGDYDLPDDFDGLCGDLTYEPSRGYRAIKKRGEAEIRIFRRSDRRGPPTVAGVRPKASIGITAQRFEILFYPIPDAIYTLSYRYEVLVSGVSVNRPYPLGTASHAETLIESCLAIAEERGDQETSVHGGKFLRRLAGDIARDNQRSASDFYGPYGDPGAREDVQFMPSNRLSKHVLDQ